KCAGIHNILSFLAPKLLITIQEKKRFVASLSRGGSFLLDKEGKAIREFATSIHIRDAVTGRAI
ncbi:MAG TPA: hypothetical protein VFT30_05365, partial [Nitrospira sp.]|nr:hypothetical protein [Nitrospira sp.]